MIKFWKKSKVPFFYGPSPTYELRTQTFFNDRRYSPYNNLLTVWAGQSETRDLFLPWPNLRRTLTLFFCSIGDKLLHESLANDNRFKNKSKSSNFPEIEQVMLAVMEEAEKQKMTLTSGYIRNMALELAKQLGIENFNASQGWLQVHTLSQWHEMNFTKMHSTAISRLLDQVPGSQIQLLKLGFIVT